MVAFATEPRKREKKQVIVDPDLYNKVKGKMIAIGTTFSDWLEEKMREEIYKLHE